MARPEIPMTSGPLVQSAYVWQRVWSTAVTQAVISHSGALDHLSLLVAQLEWSKGSKSPTGVRPSIDWAALHASGKSVGLVVRVHRVTDGQPVAAAVCRVLLDKLTEARTAGVPVCEFQIDYDCPQKNLSTYLGWLRQVRENLRATGIPLRITTLPSWLSEPRFASLIDSVDGYVLQVHAFDFTAVGKSPSICDTVQARKWVTQAAALGRPFYVALPTYRCLAGYAADGHRLGMVAEGSEPAWPTGTRLVEFSADADALSALVGEWKVKRPTVMQGVYWYRLPIKGESRNWPWRTLAAVMDGRPLANRWEVRTNVDNPADFRLWNLGEKDESPPKQIRVSWNGSQRVVMADALRGWHCIFQPNQVEFESLTSSMPFHLAPGSSIPLGWIRFDQPLTPQTSFSYEIHD